MSVFMNSVWLVVGKDGYQDGLYRIIRIYPELDYVIIFPIDSNKFKRPILKFFSDYLQGVADGKITSGKFKLPVSQFKDLEIENAKNLSIMNKNYKLIEDIVRDDVFLIDFSRSKRTDALANYSKGNKSLRKKLNRLLVKYWMYGQDKQSLLPGYDNCGNPGKDKIATSTPLGRKKYDKTYNSNLSDKYIIRDSDKRNMMNSLKKYYLKEHGISLKETYDKFILEFFESVNVNAFINNEKACRPTFKQFYYHKKKIVDQYSEIRKRKSSRDFELNFKNLHGSVSDIATRAGDAFEIDATIADVHLISSRSTLLKDNDNPASALVLGRPTIYTVIDRATRMIVGFHVSLYNASWRAARQALANAFLPKKQFCADYGIDINEGEWPCYHIPASLVCDNGEMLGLKPQQKVTPFTRLSYVKCYRGDLKSIVERRFGIFNTKLLHKLTGNTKFGKVVRGAVDARKVANTTMEELTSWLILEILRHNSSIFDDLVDAHPDLMALGKVRISGEILLG